MYHTEERATRTRGATYSVNVDLATTTQVSVQPVVPSTVLM